MDDQWRQAFWLVVSVIWAVALVVLCIVWARRGFKDDSKKK